MAAPFPVGRAVRSPVTSTAAVVLAGGRSSRMGSPKAWLPWQGRTLLQHVVDAVAVAGPVVVVRAPGQDLPPLPPGVRVVDDPVEGLGPLQGLAVGLAALEQDVAFVCSTDLPHLVPAYVQCVLGALGPATDVVLPVVHGHRQPLAAAYRTALAPACAALVAQGRLRPAFLFEQVRTRELPEPALLAHAGLVAADPGLLSVVGVNTPEELARARQRQAGERQADERRAD